MKMADDGVVFELPQRDFMRLNNLYKKTLKENDLTDDVYVFDDFMRDVFTAFLNKVRVDDIKVKVKC